jgi:hypothetical protein
VINFKGIPPDITPKDVSLNFTQNAVKKKEESVLLFRIERQG